jgi:nucleoside-diphosphate-sugar epimerase
VLQPMTEELPLAATGPKGRARALVWENAVELHRQGRIRVVEARASDFFGPGVTDGGHLGGRLMPALLHGRTVRVLGDPAVPHSWTYLPDVARTLIELGSSESAWGRPWHVPTAPPESLRAMVTKLSEAAGTPQIKVRQVPPGLVRVIGAFSPFIRELGEIRYQFQQPFVIDSSACTEQFGLTATALSTQIHANVEWWQQREAQAH